MRVTKTPWFGPKQEVGWGWRVCSWQGWAATGVLLILVVLGSTLLHGLARTLALIGLMLAYGALMLLTGDPPGGPGMRRG